MFRYLKIVTVWIAMLGSAVGYSQTVKDSLYFTNGSLIVGKLKSIKLGIVTFDPDDANDITVQLRKIKTIAATSRIFRIETVHEQVYFGKLLPHSLLKTIYVGTNTDTLSLALEDISVLYPFEKSIAERFSGTVGSGFSYTRSSGFGRLNFDGKIKYVSQKEELILSTYGIYTIYDSLFSRDKEEATLKYNYYFIGNWFATVFLVYQRNLELSLQRRYQEGLGVGNKFITSKVVYAWARTGVVLNQERSTEDVSSAVLTELFGQVEFNFFRFEQPKINCVFTQAFYYSLSQSGRFRNDGALTISWEIFKNFYLNFEPYNNYDSKPPVSGSTQFDYGVVFGINYKFYNY